jgi:predicted  nucleic acid-binding Zn-ribbon protein
MAAQQAQAEEELQRLSDVAAQAGLQAALALKSEREASLGAKRSEYDDLTTKLRASDERRLQIERELDPLRQRITELQLKEQAARLGSDQYHQMLVDAQADLEALAASVAQDQVRIHGMQTEIDRLNREIQSLGAVNLAALEELSSARERKGFLDAQSADLNEAMVTLEDAIKKIDAETRDLLGGTFKTVNEHFGRMFPELFGGGNARLVMTGEYDDGLVRADTGAGKIGLAGWKRDHGYRIQIEHLALGKLNGAGLATSPVGDRGAVGDVTRRHDGDTRGTGCRGHHGDEGILGASRTDRNPGRPAHDQILATDRVDR